MEATRMTLYSRTGCHLCQKMLADVEALRGEFRFDLEVFDVDADPKLCERYDEWVPVLEAEGIELCCYRLDAAKVREYLGRFR
jgi:hypothetical protein